MLHSTSLPQEQVAKTKMLSVVRIQQKKYLVLCTVTWDSWYKYLLFTKYLTSTNMPTAQQKKGARNVKTVKGCQRNLQFLIFALITDNTNVY